MKKYEYLEIDYTAKGVVFLCTDKHKKVIIAMQKMGIAMLVLYLQKLTQKVVCERLI